MEDQIIEEIVKKAFEKARDEHAIHTPNALANHIDGQGNLSAKTVLWLHKKYIQKNGSKRKPYASSIDQLCKYLGFADYGDYRREHQEGRPLERQIAIRTFDRGTKGGRLKKYGPYLLALVIGSVLLVIFNSAGDKGGKAGCMAWADTQYMKVSCDDGPYSPRGTEIIPLDPVKLKNFKKVKVDLTTEFFSEQTGKPMIWYVKTREGIEYFTAPGLHPITNKTLNEITPYIIQKYVPIHDLDPDSFLGNG